MNSLRQTVEALLGYLDGYDRDYPEAAPVFDAVRKALLMEVTPAQMAHADALRRENEWLKDYLHDAARLALSEYERGFADGMSEQARRSVDKAVNRMAEQKPSGSFVLWQNTLCSPLADPIAMTHSAWHDGYASGVKAEREECAKILDGAPRLVPSLQFPGGHCFVCGLNSEKIAAAIRSRT